MVWSAVVVAGLSKPPSLAGFRHGRLRLVFEGGIPMKLRWLTPALVTLVSTAASAHQAAAPTSTPPAATPEGFPAVVAVVNGTEISKTVLLRRADAMKSQLSPSDIGPDFYRRVLDDMVSSELLFQSVKEKGLAPTDGEIDVALASQSERFGGAAAFEAALARQGISLAEVKQELARELGIQKFIDRDLVPLVSVTDEEKRAFYDENASSMERPAQFRAAHILIQVAKDASPEAKAAAKTKAESIRSMIEMGQDFGELAARNSGDPGSKDNGGELPWMSKGQTVPPFEAAALALAPGEMSDVVETEFGFHIIKLLELRGSGVTPYEDVHERIEDYLMRVDIQKRLEQVVEELKQPAKIEVFI